MVSNIIGNRIKKCREGVGLTQVQLAKKLGVSPSVISGAESKRGCSKNLAIKLSQFFNKPLDFFINKSEEQFIKDKKLFETTEMVLEKLYEENILKDIDKLDDETKALIEKSFWFDVKLFIEKKRQS